MHQYIKRISKIILLVVISSCSKYINQDNITSTISKSTPVNITRNTNITPSISPSYLGHFTQTHSPSSTKTSTPTIIPSSFGGGGKIIYDTVDGIFLFDIATSKEFPISTGNDAAYGSDFSWSPTGNEVAFSSVFSDIYWEILIINLSTNEIHTFLHKDGCSFKSPSWSPDGKEIAFMTNCNALNDYRVYVSNISGSNRRQLTSFTSGDPNWSPDGKRIAFWELGTELGGIDVINSNGTGLINLTKFGDSPHWSPNGNIILFMYDGHFNLSVNNGIYLMNSDGGNIQYIAPEGVTPSWSPDGTLISIYSLVSSTIQIITTNGEFICTIPATNNPLYPMWYR